jgi:hypothetical protein
MVLNGSSISQPVTWILRMCSTRFDRRTPCPTLYWCMVVVVVVVVVVVAVVVVVVG